MRHAHKDTAFFLSTGTSVLGTYLVAVSFSQQSKVLLVENVLNSQPMLYYAGQLYIVSKALFSTDILRIHKHML